MPLLDTTCAPKLQDRSATASGECPRDVDLEEYLACPGGSAHSQHIDCCTRCWVELDRMVRQGADFDRAVLPATADAVHRALDV